MEKDTPPSERPPAPRRPVRPPPRPPAAIFMEPKIPAAEAEEASATPTPARPERDPVAAPTDGEPAPAERPARAPASTTTTRPGAAAGPLQPRRPVESTPPVPTELLAQAEPAGGADAGAVTGPPPAPAPKKATAKKAPPKPRPAHTPPTPAPTQRTAATGTGYAGPPPVSATAPEVPALTELRTTDGGTGLWERIRADPWYAPELLALAAVRRWGPDASREVGWLRATYPGATPVAVARYLQRRQVRRAGYGSVFARAIGVLAPGAALATVLGSQARLVLGTAAAFGFAPAHPDRAAELLFLLGLQPDPGSAATAVTAAQAGPTGRDSGPPAPLLRLAGLARNTGLTGLPLRRLPGAGLLAAAVSSTAATEKVARRAETLYRTRS